jgi:uncharacterized protein with von Willebrand factor type A (vWA) domain
MSETEKDTQSVQKMSFQDRLRSIIQGKEVISENRFSVHKDVDPDDITVKTREKDLTTRFKDANSTKVDPAVLRDLFYTAYSPIPRIKNEEEASEAPVQQQVVKAFSESDYTEKIRASSVGNVATSSAMALEFGKVLSNALKNMSDGNYDRDTDSYPSEEKRQAASQIMKALSKGVPNGQPKEDEKKEEQQKEKKSNQTDTQQNKQQNEQQNKQQKGDDNSAGKGKEQEGKAQQNQQTDGKKTEGGAGSGDKTQKTMDSKPIPGTQTNTPLDKLNSSNDQKDSKQHSDKQTEGKGEGQEGSGENKSEEKGNGSQSDGEESNEGSGGEGESESNSKSEKSKEGKRQGADESGSGKSNSGGNEEKGKGSEKQNKGSGDKGSSVEKEGSESGKDEEGGQESDSSQGGGRGGENTADKGKDSKGGGQANQDQYGNEKNKDGSTNINTEGGGKAGSKSGNAHPERQETEDGDDSEEHDVKNKNPEEGVSKGQETKLNSPQDSKLSDSLKKIGRSDKSTGDGEKENADNKEHNDTEKNINGRSESAENGMQSSVRNGGGMDSQGEKDASEGEMKPEPKPRIISEEAKNQKEMLKDQNVQELLKELENKALEKAYNYADEVRKMQKALGEKPGASPSGSRGVSAFSRGANMEEILDLVKNTRVREVVDLLDTIPKMGLQTTKRVNDYNRGPTIGYKYGNNIEQAVVSELAMPDDIFYMKLQDSSLIERKKGMQDKNMGPIYVLCDKSGSMEEDHDRIKWAKAVAMKLFIIAKEEHRDYYMRFFDNSPHERLESVGSNDDPIAMIKNIGDVTGDGGTNIYAAIEQACEDIKQRQVSGVSEIIVVSDGGDRIDESSLRKTLDEANAKIITVIIKGGNASLKKISERYLEVQRLDGDEILSVMELKKSLTEETKNQTKGE